ncbi:uncharacterized protein V1518DRAFT_416517 [Limtongia smithiae]|uniref:uncharacterized protein n=1 Tax=Limtongia smithiae TaxID=1125753 RepID=UPI0034CDC81F
MPDDRFYDTNRPYRPNGYGDRDERPSYNDRNGPYRSSPLHDRYREDDRDRDRDRGRDRDPSRYGPGSVSRDIRPPLRDLDRDRPGYPSSAAIRVSDRTPSGRERERDRLDNRDRDRPRDRDDSRGYSTSRASPLPPSRDERDRYYDRPVRRYSPPPRSPPPRRRYSPRRISRSPSAISFNSPPPTGRDARRPRSRSPLMMRPRSPPPATRRPRSRSPSPYSNTHSSYSSSYSASSDRRPREGHPHYRPRSISPPPRDRNARYPSPPRNDRDWSREPRDPPLSLPRAREPEIVKHAGEVAPSSAAPRTMYTSHGSSNVIAPARAPFEPPLGLSSSATTTTPIRSRSDILTIQTEDRPNSIAHLTHSTDVLPSTPGASSKPYARLESYARPELPNGAIPPLGPRAFSTPSYHQSPSTRLQTPAIQQQAVPRQLNSQSSTLQSPATSSTVQSAIPPIAPKAMIGNATITPPSLPTPRPSYTSTNSTPAPAVVSRRSTAAEFLHKLLPSVCPEVDKEIGRLKTEYAKAEEESRQLQLKKRMALLSWDRLARDVEREAARVEAAEQQLRALGV